MTLTPSSKVPSASRLGHLSQIQGRFLLIDEPGLTRDLTVIALEALGPEVRVTGAADTWKDAVPICLQMQPDVVVIRVNVPDSRWVDALAKLKRSAPKARFLVISNSSSSHTVLAVLKAGIDGFVHSKSTWHEFQDAIARMASGQKYFCPRTSAVLIGAAADPVAPARAVLTKREKEVLALIGTGYTSKQIASRLILSASTVDTHRRNLMTKIGAHNVADLVLFAIGEGLIVPSRRNN